jgi:hypothetical protein
MRAIANVVKQSLFVNLTQVKCAISKQLYEVNILLWINAQPGCFTRTGNCPSSFIFLPFK